MLVNAFSGRTSAWIFEINEKRSSTILLGAITGVAVLIYVTGLFASFNYGFIIQKHEKTLQELQQLLVTREVTAQTLHTNFGKDHQAALDSMEKISKIRYIAPESFVDASTIKSN